MKKNLDFVSTTPLFNGLPADQIAAIQRITIEKRFNKAEIIFSEGDDGEGFFVIAEGRVKVFKVSADGKEQISIVPMYRITGLPVSKQKTRVFSSINNPDKDKRKLA